jgi:hypothetical protein
MLRASRATTGAAAGRFKLQISNPKSQILNLKAEAHWALRQAMGARAALGDESETITTPIARPLAASSSKS